MKIIYKIVTAFIIVFFLGACVTEEPIKVDPNFVLSFQRDGENNALVGTNFYVLPTGSGEFLTLYDGSAGHVWGEAGATGTFFDDVDSLAVNYASAGIYKLTLVATSAKDFGIKSDRVVKSIEIIAVDERNLFTNFYITDVSGKTLYTGNIVNDSILFSVPDVTTDFNFKPTYVLNSPSAKVFVGVDEQVSGETQNDFSKPVIYTVKSAQGTLRNYVVKFSTFLASNEKAITKFQFAPYNADIGYKYSNGEVGVIDEANKIINISVNYGTSTKAKLIVESSALSTIMINNAVYSSNTNYTLGSLSALKVIAQDKSETNYTITMTDQDPVSSFTFSGLIPAPVGKIDKVNKTISIDVLNGTDITKLVAKWNGTVGKVKVGTTEQSNGVTANNFTSPLTYAFYKGTNSTPTDSYTVTVNVK